MTDQETVATGIAYACTDCDSRWYYDRARCPGCRNDSYDSYELDVGTLVADTTARVTPPGVRDENPLGLAEFDGGVTVLAQVVDGDAPSVGDDVELVGEHALRGDLTGPRLRAVDPSGDEVDPTTDAPRGRRA